MNKLVKRFKFFIIFALVVLVAGMTVYGIWGFNNTIDYKDSYELKVSIDQNVDKAKTIIEKTTNDYLKSTAMEQEAYAFQKIDDGKVLLYKFEDDISKEVFTLITALEKGLEDADLADITPKVEVGMVKAKGNTQMEWVLLSAGIAVVIMFVYMLIMEKLSGAVATLCSSVVAYLMFISIMAITRLPAIDLVSGMAGFAVVLASVLSASTVNAYKNKYKTASGEKMDASECVMSLSKSEGKKYHISLVISLFAALALVVWFVPYIMIVGGQIAVAGVSAIVSASFVTPIVWSAVKGSKK